MLSKKGLLLAISLKEISLLANIFEKKKWLAFVKEYTT